MTSEKLEKVAAAAPFRRLFREAIFRAFLRGKAGGLLQTPDPAGDSSNGGLRAAAAWESEYLSPALGGLSSFRGRKTFRLLFEFLKFKPSVPIYLNNGIYCLPRFDR